MKKNKKINLLLLSISIGIMLIESLRSIKFNNTAIFIYYIKPLIWVIIGLMVLKLPKVRTHAKNKYKGFLMEIVIYSSVFYIIVTFMAGLFLGLGKSPYSLTPLGIGKNLFSLVSITFGREVLRAYMINNSSRKLSYIWLSMICLIFATMNIPISKVIEIKSLMNFTQSFAELILPQIAISAFAMYLVYLGGAKLSIYYICITQGIQYLTPILPDLNWLTKSIIGLSGPIFSFMIVQYLYLKKSKQIKTGASHKESPIGSIITAIVSIAIIWFSIGVFPIYPSAIVTKSMKPLIDPGDVVLVRKLKDPTIAKGDIIQFSSENIFIFHRVIEIVEDKGVKKYKTKGDNNSAPDSELVTVDKIKGKVVKVIPKIGWPTLWIKDRNNEGIRDKVEF